MNNVIIIEFYSKQGFPPGKWLSEPDLCAWEHRLPCLAIRDMGMGIWKGFVGVDKSHSLYGKLINEMLVLPEVRDIFIAVYGGLSGAGRLPAKYKDFAKDFWWIGIDTSHGGDFMPLLKIEDSDPNMAKLISTQTYKDLRFIRKETNKLANLISKLK